MKKLILILLSLTMVAGISIFCACGKGGNGGNNEQPGTEQPGGTLLNFTGITFVDKTVDYDGTEHTLTVTGTVPEGAEVVYTNNKGTAVGVYNASVKISKEGYNPLNLTAKLTIKGLEFTGITFVDKTVDYDGTEHTLTVTGTVPEGAEVVYTNNKGTNAGEYDASVKISKEGYTTLSLTAKLTINPLKFTGLAFGDLTVTYNGEAHILGELTGAPEGAKITYNGREEKTDAGTYKATAKVEMPNYKTEVLEATLLIEPAQFTGLTYDSVSVKYDGADHIGDVKLVGFQPAGTTVQQTVTNSDGQKVTTAIAVGTYNYTVTLTNKNYVSATLTATLNITAEKKDMPVFASSDGTIYFANGLDNRYVYALGSDGTLTRIDYSTPKEFNRSSSSSALFITGSIFVNSVKEVKGGSVEVLYSDGNIDDFVKYSNTVYYYSSNSLKAEKSGIYKVDATNSGDEPVVTKIFEGKSNNLAVYGNYLFFTNGNDKNHLYKMDLTTRTATVVLAEKVHEYIIDNNKLYCTVNGLVNDYIACVDLASSADPVKLTNNAGEFLRVKGGKLYYNYTDLFSYVDAGKKGIWAIDLSSKTEEQIIATSNVNGFDLDANGNVVYIDTDDLHLYRYNVTNKTTTDLLEGFVAPEVTPLNTGGRTIAYGDKVYYLNMYAGKTLYVYDETNKTNSQLTANKVADFYIYGDMLYFNQVTMLTNNDLYCVNLKTGSEAVKLSSNDVREMVSDGTYLYATHYNWAGAAGGIARMTLDGTEYVKFSEVNGAKNLTIRDGKLYFINCAAGQDNGNIEYYDLSVITSTSEKLSSTNLSKNIKNVKQFIFDGDNIFYLYNGSINNSVRRTSFTTLTEGVEIASKSTNPNEMILVGDYVYYYTYAATALSKSGFYKVAKNATEDETYEQVLGYDNTYYGSDFAVTSSGNLYFLNYIAKLAKGNAHTYQLNLTDGTVTKIA